ncbi:MAG TPA: hypothetical protein VFW87_02755 [Pirellulales bacterium]|nr:hypothetical protein [Pirellulales bacterium]
MDRDTGRCARGGTTDGTGADTTSYQYNGDAQISQIAQPPLTTGGPNLVTTLHYDLSGDLIERDLPDGAKETWTVDPTWHEPTVYVDAAGRETDYALNPANGDVLTVAQVGQNGDGQPRDHLYLHAQAHRPGPNARRASGHHDRPPRHQGLRFFRLGLRFAPARRCCRCSSARIE